MNRELLETPFPPEQLRQRQGNFGNVLDYVEAHTVIQRLNDALDSAWSFEILEHHVMQEQNEVLVLGRLSTNGISKSQFGSSAITRAKQTNEIISLADDLKAAATDSLKKCASLLGVGLHLYGGSKKERPDQGQKVTPIRGGPAKEGKDQANSRISAKQHQYVLRLAQDRGMTKKEVNDHCVKTYGAGVDFITKQDASALIEALRSEQGLRTGQRLPETEQVSVRMAARRL
jgi:hypothetical protein